MLRRLLAFAVPLALFAGCPGPTKTCKDTGCAAGSVCNTNTGLCEASVIGGGGGSNGGGGGSTGGGGGGSTGGGGGGGGMMVDAGPIDPFDDGGVFVPGDICTYAIPVAFDGGMDPDGGVSVTLQVDLATAQDQYQASCSSTVSGSGTDLLFEVKTTEPKGLLVTATNTSTEAQNPVLALVASPCATFQQTMCFDEAGSTDPEQLIVPRLPAGTWYVLLENYSSTATPGTMDVKFELVDPEPAPANDTCASPETLTFVNDTISVTGTTVGAFNDTGGRPLSCSMRSANNPEVFYQFTLTDPHDVHVVLSTPMGSNLSAAVAVTKTCGAAGGRNELGCDTGAADLTAKGLQPGTYFIVVDDNGFNNEQGEFSLTATLLPPTAVPTNDTCDMPATLAPNATVMVNANDARRDYPPSCRNFSSGGDVVYQFTTTQAQKVTLTASSMAADAVLEVRGGPCETGMALECSDTANSGVDEVLTIPNLPAGTYFVVLSAYSATNGQFGLSLALDAPVPVPANDTCAAPATLTPGVSVMADLTAASDDYDLDCTAAYADVVYTFTTTQAQKVTLTATSSNMADGILELRSGACDPGTVVSCSDDTGSSAPEVLTLPNVPAGTYYVVLSSRTAGAQVGLSLALDAPVPPPANDTCSTPATLVPNVSQMVDVAAGMADYTVDCSFYSGNDVVYQFTTTQAQRAKVTVTAVGAGDSAVEIREAPCDMGTSLACDSSFGGTAPVADATNLPAGTYYVVVGARSGTQFGVQLTLEAPLLPPTNESCTTVETVTLTSGMATRSVNLTGTMSDFSEACGTFTGTGGDVVYAVSVPAAQTLTVTADGASGVDVQLFIRAPMCTATMSLTCADDTGGGGTETVTATNMTGAAATYFVIVKAYSTNGLVDLTFAAQ